MEVPKYPKQQGYYPLQEQIAYSPEQEYPLQEEHNSKERYENVTPFYPSDQGQCDHPATPVVPITQQQTSNIFAVQSQPTSMIAWTVIRPTKDHYLTLSIMLTFLCLFVGNLHTLLCTIPAIILAIKARHAETHGYLQEAQYNTRVVLILNILAFVFGILVVNYFINFAAVYIAELIPYSCNDNIYKSS